MQRFHRSWSRERSATPPHWRKEQQRVKPKVQDEREAQGRWTKGDRMERDQPDRRIRDERQNRFEARERLVRRDRDGRGQPDLRERFQRGRQRSDSGR